MAIPIRTISQMKALFTPRDHPFVQWSTLKRKSVYGWTEGQVRRQLVQIKFLGRDIWVHRKVADSLKRVNARVRATEKAKGYEKYVCPRIDCFNWRLTTSGRSLSRHAHAIALDLDPRHNAYATHKTNLPARVVNAFREEGWRWGGEYSTPDPMHFERH